MGRLRDLIIVGAVIALGAPYLGSPQPQPPTEPPSSSRGLEWRVSGMALGMTEAQIKSLLGPGAVREELGDGLTRVSSDIGAGGFCSGRSAELRTGRAVAVSGDSLSRGGQVVLRSGEAAPRVEKLLGHLEHLSPEWGGCGDVQAVHRGYRAGNIDLWFVVSNDDVIEAEMQPYATELKGKVWEFSLREARESRASR